MATGKTLWAYPHREPLDVVNDPIVSGSQVFFTTYKSSVVLDMAGDTPTELWRNEKLRGGLNTAVLVDGYLFGTDWCRLVNTGNWAAMTRLDWPFQCIDWKTGALKWEKNMKTVALMAADGKLIMLEGNATLYIAEATAQQYRELSSADVFGGANKPRRFLTPPVLYGGRIYCRNYAGDLLCIDVRK
jgi:outer membrane protein assembly factor BamB